MTKVFILMRNQEVTTDDEGLGPSYIVTSSPLTVYPTALAAMDACAQLDEGNEHDIERVFHTILPVEYIS